MSQHPDIVVSYFDLSGKAEPTRLALVIAGIPFRDERIQGHQWPQMKRQTPFGQLPTLTVDGVMYAQSVAMLRYAGRLAGLYPDDPLQALKVDMIVDQIEEFHKHIDAIFQQINPETKRELIEDFVQNKLPTPCSLLDQHISKQGKPGFSVGSSLSIADLAIYTFASAFKLRRLPWFPEDALDPYTNIGLVFLNVHSHPKVLEWNEKHSKKP